MNQLQNELLELLVDSKEWRFTAARRESERSKLASEIASLGLIELHDLIQDCKGTT